MCIRDRLLVKSGVADAINSMPTGLRGNKSAMAETIEHNVRRKISKERLNDPAFYDKMSALLDEVIKFRKERAEEYEEYLKRIADLAKKVAAGISEATPDNLDTPGKRALWNNLGQNEALTLKVDEAVKAVRPDSWRGVQAREQVIKAALYNLLQDADKVERVFLIVKAQSEY